jgi:hypothetical protein
MRSTVEIFCPFSQGIETMEDYGFFPTKEDGWVNNAIIVESGADAIMYQVEIPDGGEELEDTTEGVAMSSPVRVLNTGDEVYIAEEYIEEDRVGFLGYYPQVSLVRQVTHSQFN